MTPTSEELAVATKEQVQRTARDVETFVRHNPAISIAAAVGIGCAIGVLAKLLLTPPPPPKPRSQQLLEDLQSRLNDILGPAYERASDLAEDGAAILKKGVNSVQDVHLPNRLKRWFV